MNIGAIQGSFVSGAAKVGQGIKDAALWTGRIIATGYTKLSEQISHAWNNAAPFFIKTGHFLTIAPVLGSVTGLSAVICAVAAYKMREKKAVMAAFAVAAVACLIGAGGATGFGVLKGFTTPLI